MIQFYEPATMEGSCQHAAEIGNLELLKTLRKDNTYWDKQTCAAAAFGGHLEVLRWARTNGCPWDADTCIKAAEGGHLEVLQWALANGCSYDNWACVFASSQGHLHILQWIHATQTAVIVPSHVYRSAAHRGHFNILRWAHENGFPWDESTCANAAFGGHLEVLQWLRSNGCPWNESTCANAALGGNLEILQWARANGCPWDETTFVSAIVADQLEALIWARENGCPWDRYFRDFHSEFITPLSPAFQQYMYIHGVPAKNFILNSAFRDVQTTFFHQRQLAHLQARLKMCPEDFSQEQQDMLHEQTKEIHRVLQRFCPISVDLGQVVFTFL